MIDERIVYLIYVIVKYAAYSTWCYVGLRMLRGRGSVRAALGFGFARFGLGIVFGISLFLFAGIFVHLDMPQHPVLAYFATYVPIRFVEWAIMTAWIGRGSNAPPMQSRVAWIFGGIVVSHLADLPLILFTWEGAKQFLPVGRFLC
jgi:hypothetical protein